MKRLLLQSLICAACLVPTVAASKAFVAEPAAAPDVASPKTYAKDGLTMQLPGNWTVVEDHPANGDEQRRLLVEADKTRFEVMNVWLTINLVRAGDGPSLPEWAARSYAQEVGDSEHYGPPRYSTYPLAPGVDAHAAQFQHTVFEDSEPYARRLQLLAIKQCSAAWDCYASIWTVDANRKAADAGIRLIMETVTFAE